MGAESVSVGAPIYWPWAYLGMRPIKSVRCPKDMLEQCRLLERGAGRDQDRRLGGYELGRHQQRPEHGLVVATAG